MILSTWWEIQSFNCPKKKKSWSDPVKKKRTGTGETQRETRWGNAILLLLLYPLYIPQREKNDSVFSFVLLPDFVILPPVPYIFVWDFSIVSAVYFCARCTVSSKSAYDSPRHVFNASYTMWATLPSTNHFSVCLLHSFFYDDDDDRLYQSFPRQVKFLREFFKRIFFFNNLFALSRQ